MAGPDFAILADPASRRAGSAGIAKSGSAMSKSAGFTFSPVQLRALRGRGRPDVRATPCPDSGAVIPTPPLIDLVKHPYGVTPPARAHCRPMLRFRDRFDASVDALSRALSWRRPWGGRVWQRGRSYPKVAEPLLSKSCPEVAPKLLRDRRFDPASAKSGRFGRFLGPTQFRPTLAEFGQCWLISARFGKHRPTLVELG